jgi:two-component sensor histidine kinase
MGLFGPSTAPFLSVWHVWFASDLLGILTTAPLVIGLASGVREPPPRREFFEGVAALAAVAVMTGIFVSLPPAPWKLPVAMLFPLLLWLAARCRPVFASAGVFVVSLAIVWTITVGFGHFGDPDVPIGNHILAAQAVILGVALCAIVLAALFAERRKHAAALMMLIAELDHRVKNVLARVAAVAISTRQGSRSIDEFLRTLDGRIQSMAAAHSLLSQSRWHGVGITDLVHHQLAPYTTVANTTISGPDVMLTAAATHAVAVVLHELVTNAAKYGALSTPSGRVSVNWNLLPSSGGGAASLTISWHEIGGPPVAGPMQSGYGTSLIRELIPHELGGTVDLVFACDGACCKIDIPLEQG